MNSLLKSHHWITFRLNLNQASHRFWLLLGEAQSKCEHIAGVPLRPSTNQQLHQVFLAKGILATTAIEGNTLTEQQVRDRIEGKLQLPPSQEYLGQEIDNILEACNLIVKRLVHDEISDIVFPETILEYNQITLKNLPRDAEVIPGAIRTHEVGVGRYKAPPAQHCAQLLERLCQFLNEDFNALEIGSIARGILKATLAHLYLAWIHPFGDGNGRTARLVEFQMLAAHGVPTPAAHLLSNHYNITRAEYYRQLDAASQSGGNVFPFLEYALEGFVDGLKNQLQIIREQIWDIVWRNYINETFKDQTRATAIRQRRLALDLSIRGERVPLNKIKTITPRIAEQYAKKSSLTISRDVNALIELGLIDKNAEGVRAKREIILSFLPVRRLRDQ